MSIMKCITVVVLLLLCGYLAFGDDIDDLTTEEFFEELEKIRRKDLDDLTVEEARMVTHFLVELVNADSEFRRERAHKCPLIDDGVAMFDNQNLGTYTCLYFPVIHCPDGHSGHMILRDRSLEARYPNLSARECVYFDIDYF